MKKSQKTIIPPFFITFGIMLFLCIINKYAPFGNKTFAWQDANIQYLDFFSYLKDIITGANTNYTLGSGLGQNMIAVFSYYLSSPLNILVIFFEKSDLQIFFNLLVIIKLSLASMAFSYFLVYRFQGNLKKQITILLAVSYGMCQYNIAQASNIMWLDGVYLLPLLLLGVYKVVHEKKSTLLIITSALSILFNWYIGIINLLFAVAWVFLEVTIQIIKTDKWKLKQILYTCIKCAIAMLIGATISMIILLPTAVALQSGRGNLEFGLLKNLSFIGKLPSIIPAYTIGATSTSKVVSLFCGSFALIGVLGILCTPKVPKKEKILFSILLIFIACMFYWNPLLALFSLLKPATCYWYRYSHLGIFTLLFISAYFYNKDHIDRKITKPIYVYIGLILVLGSIFPVNSDAKIYLTIMFILCIMYAILQVKNKKWNFSILYILVILELSCSAHFLMKIYSLDNAQIYKEYTQNQIEQIKDIQQYDKSMYRIHQTSTRNTNENNNLTANYNEPLAFHYWGISSYTSDPDDIQRKLLENLGYKRNGVNMNITNTSILGSDSFLGIKYILSNYPIEGLQETNLKMKNEKKVYENPYALPIGFTYTENKDILKDNIDPFLYQNDLYSKILGRKVNLYNKVSFSITETVEDFSISTYEIDTPKGNYALYGNLINGQYESILSTHDYQTGYFMWLAPSVFSIPKTEEKTQIKLISKEKNDKKEEQFYALNLDLLQEVTNEIKMKKPYKINIEKGKIDVKIKSENEKEKFLLQIPYDKGWHIQINGKKVKPSLFADSLIELPLEKGENDIQMKYHIPYGKEGAIISFIGLLLFLTILIKEKKYKKER